MPVSGVLTNSFLLDTVCFAQAYLDTGSQSLITSHGTPYKQNIKTVLGQVSHSFIYFMLVHQKEHP